MRPGQVYRCIGAIDIAPMLAVLPGLDFVGVNIGNANPAKSPCTVVPPSVRLPAAVTAFVAGLSLGGETRRLLLRKLGPRQGMPPHIDRFLAHEASWRRFQVPLTSHPDIVMRWPNDGVSMHLAPGFLYEVRFDRLHEVVHGADCERVHLQIDQVDATI